MILKDNLDLHIVFSVQKNFVLFKLSFIQLLKYLDLIKSEYYKKYFD